jgi:hypothetical protein
MGVTRALAAASTVCGLALVACGPPAAVRTVPMRMRGAPPDATVTIDDHIVGRLDVVAARGVALPAGTHRVSVEREGYLPWDKIIEAREAPVVLDVRLERVPD